MINKNTETRISASHFNSEGPCHFLLQDGQCYGLYVYSDHLHDLLRHNGNSFNQNLPAHSITTLEWDAVNH